MLLFAVYRHATYVQKYISFVFITNRKQIMILAPKHNMCLE